MGFSCTNLLDVIIGQCTSILELLAGEDQTLLIRRNTLLVLDLGLDIVDRIGGFDLKSDGFACEGLDESSRMEELAAGKFYDVS